MKVATVEEMRGLDRTAMERFGIPGAFLMENAGQAVYFAILSRFGVAGKRFVILAGAGHNGGDGLVVARKLHSSGGDVRLLFLSDPARYEGDPALHLEMVQRGGVSLQVKPSAEEIREAVAGADVVVDAMLGTGIAREVGGLYREAVEAVNASEAAVVAVDIPSGVDGNTGKVWGVAVRADLTVTFGLPKRGNLLYPGAGLCGELLVSHISFPPGLSRGDGIAVGINVPPPLPERRPDGHKGSFGDALFVAGAASYFGAPAFSALAMLRAGGGYARLASPRSVVPHLAAIAPEVVYAPQEETPQGTLALAAEPALLELLELVDVVAVGPGTSLHEETQRLLARVIAESARPVIVDGDGLAAVAKHPGLVISRTAPTILTPHPGEMARLCGCGIADVLADPIPMLQDTAGKLGAIMVLKGAHSLIGLPDGTVFINTTGNSGMATAGSGDVLTGTIAAMLGLGLDPGDAARTGVYLHGLAGDLAAEAVGADGVTARTILDFLPDALAAFRESHARLTADACGAARVV